MSGSVMPSRRRPLTLRLVPFATNMQFQVLTCPSPPRRRDTTRQETSEDGSSSDETDTGSEADQEEVTSLDEDNASSARDKYIRLILNDAVVPLTGIRGCPEHEEGLCSLEGFVESMKEIVESVDFEKDCGGVVRPKEDGK
jgi:hypothetical protein